MIDLLIKAAQARRIDIAGNPLMTQLDVVIGGQTWTVQIVHSEIAIRNQMNVIRSLRSLADMIEMGLGSDLKGVR